MPIALSDFIVSPANKDVLPRMNAITMELSGTSARPVPDICVYHSFEPIEREWRMLEAARHVSLHQTLAWCRAWAATVNPELAIVVGRLKSKVVFILPLEIVTTDIGRVARFIGAPHSNLNTGLFVESFAVSLTKSATRDIFARIRRQLAGRADLIRLTNMPATWRGVRLPWLLAGAIENQNSSYQLPILSDMEATLEQIHAKRKRKLFSQSVRRLAAFGGYEHVIARSNAERIELLDAFLQQKAARQQALQLPNPFRDSAIQSFLRDAASSSTDDDTCYPLRLNALRLKDEDKTILAVAGLSRKGEHIICQFGSINDDAVEGVSPGEFLFYLMIEQAVASRATIFDFGIGDQPYKKRWCPVETQHFDVLIPISFKGRVGGIAVTGWTRLKAAIKRHSRLYGIVQRLRVKAQNSGSDQAT